MDAFRPIVPTSAGQHQHTNGSAIDTDGNHGAAPGLESATIQQLREQNATLQSQLTFWQTQLREVETTTGNKIETLSQRLAALESEWADAKASLAAQSQGANNSNSAVADFFTQFVQAGQDDGTAASTSDAHNAASASKRRRTRNSLPAENEAGPSTPASRQGQASASRASAGRVAPDSASRSGSARKRTAMTAGFESPFIGPSAEAARTLPVASARRKGRPSAGASTSAADTSSSSSSNQMQPPPPPPPAPAPAVPAPPPAASSSASANFFASLPGSRSAGASSSRRNGSVIDANLSTNSFFNDDDDETGDLSELQLAQQMNGSMDEVDTQIAIPRVKEIMDVVKQWEEGDPAVGMRPLKDWTSAMSNHPRYLSTFADRKRIYQAFKNAGGTLEGFYNRYGQRKALKEYKMVIQALGKQDGTVKPRERKGPRQSTGQASNAADVSQQSIQSTDANTSHVGDSSMLGDHSALAMLS